MSVKTGQAQVVLTLVSQSHGTPLLARVLFGVALVALAVALGSALLVVVPRLHRGDEASAPGDFLYFGLYFGAVRTRSVDQLIGDHIDPLWAGKKVANPLVAVTHQAKRLADI